VDVNGCRPVIFDADANINVNSKTANFGNICPDNDFNVAAKKQGQIKRKK